MGRNVDLSLGFLPLFFTLHCELLTLTLLLELIGRPAESKEVAESECGAVTIDLKTFVEWTLHRRSGKHSSIIADRVAQARAQSTSGKIYLKDSREYDADRGQDGVRSWITKIPG